MIFMSNQATLAATAIASLESAIDALLEMDARSEAMSLLLGEAVEMVECAQDLIREAAWS